MEKESERPMAELFTKAGRIRIAVEDIYYFEYTSRMTSGAYTGGSL